ncbi:MAG: hypothetical protein A3J24_09605 [Deltaproteobacteria bacterium RIFCSPLOWO2_02_FULL_53_8]|nr:MAG: hypothetical protein A3J24_09605 [Deltaproteobacteria bacterium RIFCSPLOWO2_02_FULL_53_8]
MKAHHVVHVRKYATLFIAVLLLAGLGPWHVAIAQQTSLPPEIIHYADIVLYNGNILTADDNFTVAEAVAIGESKFIAVGKTDRIVAMAGPNTRRIDLKGKTVVPGILDLHQHPFTEGMLQYFTSKNNVQWEGRLPEMNKMEADIGVAWDNAEMALRDIGRAVAAAKPGEAIVIPRAWGRGQDACVLLTREQIDSVSPDNPVFFIGYVNLAASAMNSKAASVLNLAPGTQQFRTEGSACLFSGGQDTGDPSTVGRFSDVVKAVPDFLYWHWPLEEMMAAYRLGTRRASSNGVTLVKEHSALPVLAGIRELWARGELTVRLRMPYPLYPQGGEFDVVIPGDQAEALFRRVGNLSGIGDDMWRFVGIRPQGVGGNILQGGAWTLEPKNKQLPGFENTSMYGGRGDDNNKESFTGREALVQAVRYGWDVSADHTVGDRAVKEVLEAIEEGLRTQVVKRPNQLLTMNHTPMATPSQIQKMSELGMRASIGPWHLYWEPEIEAAVFQYGIERVHQMMPMKSYIKAGIKPALEGDLFIDPPFWRMERAVTRKDTKYGRVWNPKEAVTRQEALWMSTNWPAYHIGEQMRIGTIEARKLADLVVIDRDYMTIPEDEIHAIKPLMTIVDGRVVYEVEGGLR